MKEKLQALLKEAPLGVQGYALGNIIHRHTVENIADNLLSNGVIVPPIGLGRTCFDVRAKCVDECRVSSVTQKADGSLKVRITNLRYRAAYEITPDEIGKTVFLTHEEAEKALAEREGKG